MADEKVTNISQSHTLEEMAEFWDTHSLGDYDSQTYEVDMVFDPAARQSHVDIEPELLADLRRVAQERHITLETLVNVWLRQRVDQLKLHTGSD